MVTSDLLTYYRRSTKLLQHTDADCQSQPEQHDVKLASWPSSLMLYQALI